MRHRFVLFALCVSGCLSGCALQANAQQLGSRWLQKSQQAGLSPLRKKAYQAIAQVEASKIVWPSYHGGIDILAPRNGTQAPLKALHDMGLDVLPVLAEALDDATPTLVVDSPDPRRMKRDDALKVWQVNELVGRLIPRIAERQFVIPIPDSPSRNVVSLERDIKKHPELTPQFQKLVLDWHEKNRRRTLLQRKVADVDDGWFRNRLDAVQWLAQRKARAAEPAIIGYIERTLLVSSQQSNSLLDSELAESALALGQIGGRKSLPAVRKVCAHLVAGTDYRYSPGFGQFVTPRLFMAYHGMALLGAKAQALKELNAVYSKHQAKAQEHDRKQYQKLLKEALKWGPKVLDGRLA